MGLRGDRLLNNNPLHEDIKQDDDINNDIFYIQTKYEADRNILSAKLQLLCNVMK